MSRRRRNDSEHVAEAREHLRVLVQHLARGGLDDPLVRDAVCHRLEVAIDTMDRVSPDLLNTEAVQLAERIYHAALAGEGRGPAGSPGTGPAAHS